MISTLALMQFLIKFFILSFNIADINWNFLNSRLGFFISLIKALKEASGKEGEIGEWDVIKGSTGFLNFAYDDIVFSDFQLHFHKLLFEKLILIRLSLKERFSETLTALFFLTFYFFLFFLFKLLLFRFGRIEYRRIRRARRRRLCCMLIYF